MDLTSLINTIVTSNAAIVAIIGGLLVSRVISLANDKHFFERQISEIDNNVKHKKSMESELEEYLFEDNLTYFITKRNLILIIEGKGLERIIKETKYDYLSEKQLKPYYEILVEIKNEVETILFSDQGLSEDEKINEYVFMKELIIKMEKKHLNREKWYEQMFEAYLQLNSFTNIQLVIEEMQLANNSRETYYQKKKEKERVVAELSFFATQRNHIIKNMNKYIQTRGIWLGIGLLVLVSILGILYPTTLLPYQENSYDDKKTKIMLICIFGICLTMIFSYLSIQMHLITKKRRV